MDRTWLYLGVMIATTYLIRTLPLSLLRGRVENPFIQSFLYYVPYVTLAVMTFPAVIEATQAPVAGVVALIIGIAAAWTGVSLFGVAVCCSAAVLIMELILI